MRWPKSFWNIFWKAKIRGILFVAGIVLLLDGLFINKLDGSLRIGILLVGILFTVFTILWWISDFTRRSIK